MTFVFFSDSDFTYFDYLFLSVLLKMSSFHSLFVAESYYIFFICSPLQKYFLASLVGYCKFTLGWCAFCKSCFLLRHSSWGSAGFLCRSLFITSRQFHPFSPVTFTIPCHRHHYRIPFQTRILWRFFTTAFHSAAKSRFLEGVTSMSIIIHKVYNFSWTLLKKQYELNYFRNFLDC